LRHPWFRLPIQPSPTSTFQPILRWCDRWRHLLFACLAAMYVAGFNTQWHIGPDSALSLTIARNLAEGEGFVHPLGEHQKVAPGLAVLAAVTMRVTGTDQLWLANAVMMAMTGAALALAYTLFRLHAGRPVAVVVTVLLACSESLYRYSVTVLADVPFLVGALLCLVGWELLLPARAEASDAEWGEASAGGGRAEARSRAVRWGAVALMVVGIVVMALFRTVVVTFVGAMGLASVWHACRRGHRGLVVAAVLATALSMGGVVLYGLSGGDEVDGFRSDIRLMLSRFEHLDQTLGETLPTNAWHMLSEALPEAVLAVDVHPGVWWMMGAGVLALGVALWVRQPLWGLLMVAFTVQMLVFLVVDRYFLPLLPLLALGWWSLAMMVDRRFRQPHGERLCVVVLALWLAPNLIHVGDQILTQRQRPYHAQLNDGKYAPALVMVDRLRARFEADSDVVIVAPREFTQELLFLSDRPIHPPEALADIEPPFDRVYVIRPMDEAVEQLLAERGLRLSGAVFNTGAAQVDEVQEGDEQAWSLHRVQRDVAAIE